MPTQPRPLGNKAKRQVEQAEALIRQSNDLLTGARQNLDRRPDTAMAQIDRAMARNLQAENLLVRLRAGDFTQDD